MRKIVISVAVLVASLGVLGFAPSALAGTEDTTTTEVAGYPPEVTTTTAATTTTAESLGPVTIAPEPSTGPAVIGADLPSTGGGIAPVQIGVGLIVIGLLVLVFVRRRRHSSTAPAS